MVLDLCIVKLAVLPCLVWWKTRNTKRKNPDPYWLSRQKKLGLGSHLSYPSGRAILREDTLRVSTPTSLVICTDRELVLLDDREILIGSAIVRR
jgi:hypothetical protein